MGQMVAGASGAGYVACDGRGDPVPVFGCALAIGAQDNGRAAGVEPGVTAARVEAGEVAKQDQIGRSRGQSGKAQGAAEVGELSLGE